MKHDIWEKLPSHLYLQLKRWDYRLKAKEAFEVEQQRRTTVTEDGFSYRSFDEQQAIFVHIPKCAGDAINQCLFGNRGGGYTTLEQYLNIFEPRCIADYFKFTFVRNPWDRLVSAYFYLKRGGAGEQDRHWYEDHLSGYADFDEFVRHWLTRRQVRQWHHFTPQYYYMLDRREKVRLDFVGFVENIEADFAHVADRIGVDVRLSEAATGHHADYRDYYTPQTRDIVAEVYAEDIRLLGYSFDNGNLPQQIASRDSGRIYTLRS